MVTPEGAAGAGKALVEGLLALPARLARRLRSGSGRLESLPLAPLVPLARRLESLASPAPARAAAALARACTLVDGGFPCPRLLVLQRVKKMGLLTLSLDLWPRDAGARFVVFVTGSLLAAAGPAELEALLAREVALIGMLHPPVPEVWAVKTALLPRPRAQSQKRKKREGDANGPDKLGALALKEFGELCRTHYGLGLLALRAGELPAQLREPASGLAARLRSPWPLSDVLDAAGMKLESGSLSGPIKLTVGRARELEQDLQLRRYVLGGAPSVQASWKKLQAFEPSVAGARGPATDVKRLALGRRKRSQSPVKLLLTGWTAARRAEEARADRVAAEAVGSIMPVAAGLVLLHGSDTDRRRLGRGELPGLLEDCRAEQAPRRRWATWWTSVVKMKLRPPLYIRLAELADWAASDEGRSRLPRSRYEVTYGWLGQLLAPLRWVLERLGLRR